MKKIAYLFILLTFVGCSSHSIMRGNVAMKLSSTQAHICMGDNELKVGDEVTFIDNDCSQYDNEVAGLQGLCKLFPRGKGIVVKTINSHYSVIETVGTFDFSEGMMVQKSPEQ